MQTKLAEVFEAEFDNMVKLARAFLAQTADVEDAVMNAFVSTAHRIDDLENPGGYLRTSVVNECRRRLRNESRRQRIWSRHVAPAAQRRALAGDVEYVDDLLAELSEAIKQFYDATVQLGIQDSVTTFTASDFGRTFPTNGQGSDHGWGNHQLIVGGAAQGGDIYGSMPVLEVDGPNDTGSGRWIPTTSVDEYSATLAKWFGVSANDMETVFPNLGRFARPDLGFLA